jgi:hypothetical protein
MQYLQRRISILLQQHCKLQFRYVNVLPTPPAISSWILLKWADGGLVPKFDLPMLGAAF